MPTLVTFHRLKANTAEPVTFYPDSDRTVAIAGVVRIGGLQARQIKNQVIFRPGRFDPVTFRYTVFAEPTQQHTMRMAGVVRMGGLVARQVHECALAGIVRLGGLTAQKVDGTCALAGIVKLAANFTMVFDINVHRVNFRQGHFAQGVALRQAASGYLAQQVAVKSMAFANLGWMKGQTLTAASGLGQTVATPLTAVAAMDLRHGVPMAHTAGFLTGTLTSFDKLGALDLKTATPLNPAIGWAGIANPPRQEIARQVKLSVAQARSAAFGVRFTVGLPGFISRPLDIAVGRQPLLLWREPVPPIPPPQNHDNTVIFRRLTGDRPNEVIFNYHSPFRLPIRRSYHVNNTAALVLYPSLEPLNAKRLQVSVDHQSWAWTLTASLFWGERAKVTPTGDPIEVQATLNGHIFRFLLSRPGESRAFNSREITLRGRSRSAWLDTPHALETTSVNTEAFTAAQLAEQQLLYTGWTLDWQAVDWLVPAGAFSLDRKTPIQAIAQLADAAGAYIQTDAAEQIIHVLPEYPTLPWHWSTEEPALSLPCSALLKIDHSDWDAGIPYNAVVVAGQTADGIAALVRKDGFNGSILAPQIINPLMTHLDAARAKGGAILANASPHTTASVVLPLGESGLILPGIILEIEDLAGTWKGLTRGVSLSADYSPESGLKILQTVEIERHFT